MNNIKAWYTTLLLALAICLASAGHAGAQDTTGYQRRAFSPERLASYRNNPRYRYERAIPKPIERERVKDEDDGETRFRPNIQGPRTDFSGFFKVLLWVLIIGGAAFIIIQVLRVRFGKLVKKKSDEAVVEVPKAEHMDEDIRKMEFDDMIQKAIDEKRYRYAVRLLYLRALRQLQDRSLINWRREKTNHDYLRELQDQRLRPIFNELTFVFEYIWYGEFPVDQNHFNAARSGFLEFDQALRQRDAK